jgi:hypothetical protein
MSRKPEDQATGVVALAGIASAALGGDGAKNRPLYEFQSAVSTALVAPRLARVLQSRNPDAVLSGAAYIIQALAMYSEDNARAITAAGCVPPLVACLKSQSPTLLAHQAAQALGGLSTNPESAAAIMEAGGVRHVVPLLRSSSCNAQSAALVVLNSLSVHTSAAMAQRLKIAAEGGTMLAALLHLVNSPVANVQYEAANVLANIVVSKENAAVVTAAGGVRALLPLLAHRSSADVQAAAAAALAGLSVIDENKVVISASAGTIATLTAMLTSPSVRVQGNAAHVLGNLAVNASIRVAIAAAGAIPVLVDLLRARATYGTLVDVRERAAAALQNLTRHTESAIAVGAHGGARLLLELLASSPSIRCQEDSVVSLYNMCLDAGTAATVVAAGAVPILTRFLASPTAFLATQANYCLLVLAPLVADGAAICAACLDAAGIGTLVMLLQSRFAAVRERAAAVLELLPTGALERTDATTGATVREIMNSALAGATDDAVRKAIAAALKKTS